MDLQQKLKFLLDSSANEVSHDQELLMVRMKLMRDNLIHLCEQPETLEGSVDTLNRNMQLINDAYRDLCEAKRVLSLAKWF